MSNLESALSAVKKGMAMENSGNEIQDAIKAYQEAITHFTQVVKTNELKNQELQIELQDNLAFYSNKVQYLQSQVKKNTLPKSQEDQDIMNRIASTVVIEKPKTRFNDVAGLGNVKKALRKAVVLPITHPECFKGNVRRYKGFLLFGPPGTGKSHIARAVAGEANGTTFFSLSASDLMSKYQGESENLIKGLFQAARQMKPSIIFIDEVDSLALSRTESDNEGSRRVKTELFVQMQGATVDNSDVFVIAATNTPQSLDEAFRRRFDKLLYIPLPDEEARLQLLQMNFSDCNISKAALTEATSLSEGLSGSDISVIATKAQMLAFDQLEDCTHFKKVLKGGKPFWKPCVATDAGAIRVSIDELPKNSVDFTPVPTEEDVLQCVREAKASIDTSNIRKMEQFAEEKGEAFRKLPTVSKQRKVSKTRTVFEFLLNFF